MTISKLITITIQGHSTDTAPTIIIVLTDSECRVNIFSEKYDLCNAYEMLDYKI